MPRYYPVSLTLKDKRCLVIGAGSVALRKVRRLLECGARVLVISPVITPVLQTMADKVKIAVKRRKVVLKDLNGAYLVIAATADRKVNAAVSSYCCRKGILVNVVDSPGECNFILPSIVKRGDLTISISTDGVSPALAKKIRQDLEKMFGAEYAALLRIMKKIRPQALRKMKSARSRKSFFNKMLRPGMLDLLRRKKLTEVMRKMKRMLGNAGN